MCYTCSPECDNCNPKMLECPHCHRVNMLKQSACAYCGSPFTEALKDDARRQWEGGRRYGSALKPKIERMSRTRSPFMRDSS